MNPVAHSTSGGLSLLGIEFALTLVTLVFAICFPRTGSNIFSKLELIFGRVAERRKLSVFICGISACALRLLILPLSPIPQPSTQDDFSFLLAADTFAHGRLTNPTHPMWVHFESFHISFRPTYMSMYFPLQGMVMAAGKVIAGHPWWGVWASCGLMCAAICWMLQGWLPPGWALLGGMLSVFRLALFSYWINSYTGAGALAATGGALVLGAFPRIRTNFRTRDFFWMALGMAVLANTRPYEGLFICAPAAAALAWFGFRQPHPNTSVLLRRIAPAALLLAATVAFMGYYNHRVFGNALTPPYKLNRQTYAVVPYFFWQSFRPEPVYRHRILRDFYAGTGADSEPSYFRGETGFVSALLEGAAHKLPPAVLFCLGFALLPPLIMLPRVLRNRHLAFLIIAGFIFAVGLVVQRFFIQHYLAPATALVYAILLQCMRDLRRFRPWGLFLVRATPILCTSLVLIRLLAQPLGIDLGNQHLITGFWYGTAPLGLDRVQVLKQLERLPGPQLALVAYSPNHMLNDWVYNGAEIDKSKVVWARQMDAESNRELINYYKDRSVWLIEPDNTPSRISPYPAGSEPHMVESPRAQMNRASFANR